MGRVWHKYGATRCEQDNIKFPSLLEKNCYLVLKELQSQGKIRFFLRQIGFDLPGGYRHLVDFCVFLADHVIFLEAKGRDLDIGKIKRLQVEDIYGIPIVVVTAPKQIEQKLFT